MSMTDPELQGPSYPEISDEEKIRAIEAAYKRCWACIQAGASQCRHLIERREERQLDEMRVSSVLTHWDAQTETQNANLEAFNGTAYMGASPIEVKLLEAFWRAGLEPVQQYRIGRCTVDFAFVNARLIVEADGKDYHQDTDREYRRDEFLRSRGWHVKHFTGRDIHMDADACVREVYRLARSSLI